MRMSDSVFFIDNAGWHHPPNRLCLGDELIGAKEINMLDYVYCCPDSVPDAQKYAASDRRYYVTPSYIDIQVNGYNEVTLDGNDGVTVEKLEHISESLKHSGCAIFVPTLITSPYEILKKSLEQTELYMKKHPGRIPGLHIEGPFISPVKKGIHKEAYIRKLEGRDLELILRYAGAVSYITLDPNAVTPDVMKELLNAGIRLSLGHTEADYRKAEEFIGNGATLGTHLYNAMTMAANGRTPMAVEAILNSDTVYCGVIGDGIHVNYALVRLAHRLLGDRFVLVTDCLAAAGTDPEKFRSFVFAEKEIFNDLVKGCIDAKGTLGGSRLTMTEGVQNLVRHAGFTLNEAVYAATLAPAKALGINLSGNYNILDEELNLVDVISGKD